MRLNRRTLEKRWLMGMSLLALALGVPIFWSLFKDPRSDMIRSMSEHQAQRNPASQTDYVQKLPCPGNELRDQSFSNWHKIQLASNGCPNPWTRQIRITNKTNGFTASAIFLDDREFVTDYIELAPGLNEIEIQDPPNEPKTWRIHRTSSEAHSE